MLDLHCLILKTKCIVLRTLFIRPPDIVVRNSSIFCLLFHSSCYPSELTELNSTKTGHTFGSECDLKMYVQNLAIDSP